METEDSSLDAVPAAVRVPPRQGLHGQPPSRHTPGVLAMTERQRTDFWKLVAISVSVFSLLLSWLCIRSGRAGERIFVLDPSGTLHAGPVEVLSESRDFFQASTLFAVNAALQRSPAGFDLYDLLKLYYSPRALQRLEEDLQKRREDVRLRNIQQKPIVESIGDPVKAGDSRIVEVKGRLVSAGAYAGQSFYDEPPFVLVLTYRRNPDIGKSGAYPWVCDDFELNLSDAPKS